MPKIPIHFFSEEISFNLKNKNLLRKWIKQIITSEGHQLKELNFIFCTDEYLLRINQSFLQHDDYTDVITFDNSDLFKTIIGDIFISIDRIKENAKQNNVSLLNELCRVMIHGTLHLLGYKDKSKTDKKRMTKKENQCLATISF